MRAFVSLLIRLYQRYLSPLKGYRCAYAVCHGGKSCSGMVLDIVRQEPVTGWRIGIRDQFQACREAHLRLSRGRREKKRRQAGNRASHTDCCDPSLACECVSLPRACARPSIVDSCDIDACI